MFSGRKLIHIHPDLCEQSLGYPLAEAVLQKRWEEHDGREVTLPVPGCLLFHATHLTFPEHVHRFISLQSSLRALHRKEAHCGLDQSFDKAMVLLDQVVEILDLPQFHTFSKRPSSFELCNSLWVGSILIGVDYPRSRLRGWDQSA
jgi:hypothetical protein